MLKADGSTLERSPRRRRSSVSASSDDLDADLFADATPTTSAPVRPTYADPLSEMSTIEKEIVRCVGTDNVERLAEFAAHRAAIERAVGVAADRGGANKTGGVRAGAEAAPQKRRAALVPVRQGAADLLEESSDESSFEDSRTSDSSDGDGETRKASKQSRLSRNRMSSILFKDPEKTDLLQGATDQESAEISFLFCDYQNELEGQMLSGIKTAGIDGKVLHLLPREVTDRLVEDYKRIQVYFRHKKALLEARSRQKRAMELGKKKPTAAHEEGSEDEEDDDANEEDGAEMTRQGQSVVKRGSAATREILNVREDPGEGKDGPTREQKRKTTRIVEGLVPPKSAVAQHRLTARRNPLSGADDDSEPPSPLPPSARPKVSKRATFAESAEVHNVGSSANSVEASSAASSPRLPLADGRQKRKSSAKSISKRGRMTVRKKIPDTKTGEDSGHSANKLDVGRALSPRPVSSDNSTTLPPI